MKGKKSGILPRMVIQQAVRGQEPAPTSHQHLHISRALSRQRNYQ